MSEKRPKSKYITLSSHSEVKLALDCSSYFDRYDYKLISVVFDNVMHDFVAFLERKD